MVKKKHSFDIGRVIEASEEYHENSALPLPAQMLRARAEKMRDKKSGFSFL